jgi:integrase
MRIGEAAGLHINDLDLDNCVIYVRRSVWNGQELPPKTKNAIREIDIDSRLAEMLTQHIGAKRAGQVFEARNGSPISGNNVRKRVLHPLLKRLGIQKAGLHSFRHSRVTQLRKNGTPEDLQKQWIGHSSLRTTTGIHTLIRNLNIGVWRQAKRDLISLLDPMEPNSAMGKSAATV